MNKWELVTDRWNDESGIPVDVTERLKVPGGWLYRTWKSGFSGTGAPDLPDVMAMVFLPDAPEIVVGPFEDA